MKENTDLPYDGKIDDPEWLYRFQSIERIKKMRDAIGDFIAPYHWSEDAWHHEIYANISKQLEDSEAIYTISVWRNMSSAYREFDRCATSSAPKSILIRIPRASVNNSRLKWAEDEHLPDEALLLYEVNNKSQCHPYGKARIPFSEIRMSMPYWQEFHVVNYQNIFAVNSVYSKEYTTPQSFDDYPDAGLPWQEYFLRTCLHRLTVLESEFKRIGRFQYLRRSKNRVVVHEINNTIYKLCSNSEEFRCTIFRLERHLPKCHPWNKYAMEFGKFIREHNSGLNCNFDKSQNS